MTLLSITVVYALAAAAAALSLAAAAVGMRITRRRRRQWDCELAGRYLRLLLGEQFREFADDAPLRYPHVGRRRARLILAETMAALVRSACGLDTGRLRRVADSCRLDRYLLRRAALRRGSRRAYCLALLSCLPLDERAAECVGAYARSRCRSIRFQSLLAGLSADPSAALRLLAGYPEPLTAVEIAAVVALLCRGILPIAYEPLVGSPNRNLRMLGLAIVRRFGIVEAEPLLLQAVAADPSSETGCEALYVLCALHCRLSRARVMRRIGGMPPDERRALLRFMAQEGYSARALALLFEAEDRPYFESLVDSYKRRIVCG